MPVSSPVHRQQRHPATPPARAPAMTSDTVSSKASQATTTTLPPRPESTAMSDYATVLSMQFNIPVPNEDLTLLGNIKAMYPTAQHVALADTAFPLSAFLHAHGVAAAVAQNPPYIVHELVAWDTAHARLYSRLLTGVLAFRFADTDFVVYKVCWTRDGAAHTLYDFVFEAPEGAVSGTDADAPGRAFITAVYEWANSLKDEMWVFEQGRWTKDKELWAAVQIASWDNLVLDTAFLEGLRRDTQTFFATRDIYKSLGVAWQRGMLLLGPSGNGKTESIKVLLKESGQTALYVKSFTTQHGPEHGVRTIFEHARNNAPCILVIEDVDTLLTPDVLPFFLDELDGIDPNEGVLTIATTNHPERIDGALLDRPERFDARYEFAAPRFSLRARFAAARLAKIRALPAGIVFPRADEYLAEVVARETDGWSFALLGELFASFLLRVAHDRSRTLPLGDDDDDVKVAKSGGPSADTLLLLTAERLSAQRLQLRKTGTDDAGALAGSSMRVSCTQRASVGGSDALIHAGFNF